MVRDGGDAAERMHEEEESNHQNNQIFKILVSFKNIPNERIPRRRREFRRRSRRLSEPSFPTNGTENGDFAETEDTTFVLKSNNKKKPGRK